MPATLHALVSAAEQLLEPAQFSDYCPNGLQVEGRSAVRRLITGVTASQAFLDRAVSLEADAVLVHHGYFWKGENPCVVGMKRRRLATLLRHDISLLTYHLPLDAHPRLGNNAQLAERLGITVTGGLQPDNPRPVGNEGELDDPLPLADFAARVAQQLNREPLVVAGSDRPVHRIAWCTGGAQGYIDQAIALGVDAFLSGEISEQTVHTAREAGIHYIAAGHHATERYGAPAVGAYLASQLGIEHQFVDVDNPV